MEYNPRTVEEVFRDYQGRRNGLIRALTTEVERFYRQCDPGKPLACDGFPSEKMGRGTIPAARGASRAPSTCLGINSLENGIQKRTGCLLKRLFNMINDLPTVFDVVALSSKKQPAEKSAVSNHSSTKSKSNTKGRGSESQLKYAKIQGNDEEDELEEEEDEDEHGDTLCGACGENYASDEFWICCDICERWFHGKCVKITPARAEHIKQYKCPSCSSSKRARP
ncbi:PHD finger protein ALFIN-LIKE 4 [Tanacetum coccineum]